MAVRQRRCGRLPKAGGFVTARSLAPDGASGTPAPHARSVSRSKAHGTFGLYPPPSARVELQSALHCMALLHGSATWHCSMLASYLIRKPHPTTRDSRGAQSDFPHSYPSSLSVALAPSQLRDHVLLAWQGYQWPFQDSRRVLTVFSASNYSAASNNKGAIALLGPPTGTVGGDDGSGGGEGGDGGGGRMTAVGGGGYSSSFGSLRLVQHRAVPLSVLVLERRTLDRLRKLVFTRRGELEQACHICRPQV